MAGLFGTPEESEAIGSLCNLGTLPAIPTLAAEVELDRIPEVVGQSERLRAARPRHRPAPRGRGASA